MQRVLQRIAHGVPWPWLHGKPPDKPIRTLRNRSDLAQHAQQLWRTLDEQLREASILPWDVVSNGLPLGMSPIKVVAKSGTDKMRVVIALCDINAHLDPDAGKCKLPTLHTIRSVFSPYDWGVTGDQHNSLQFA